MSDLAAFISARLDEAEAMALAAGEDHNGNRDEKGLTWAGSDGGYDGGGEVRDGHGWPIVYNEGSPNTAQALHIALHDPARVLREVEARRAILALHSVTVDRERVRDDSGQLVDEVAVSCALCGWFAAVEGSGCMTIQLLAGAWSDHPDYHQDWKP